MTNQQTRKFISFCLCISDLRCDVTSMEVSLSSQDNRYVILRQDRSIVLAG